MFIIHSDYSMVPIQVFVECWTNFVSFVISEPEMAKFESFLFIFNSPIRRLDNNTDLSQFTISNVIIINHRCKGSIQDQRI